MASATTRNLLAPLLPSFDKKIALIKLNTPIAANINCLRTLWKRAALRAVVDGAVNELYSYRQVPLTDGYDCQSNSSTGVYNAANGKDGPADCGTCTSKETHAACVSNEKEGEIEFLPDLVTGDFDSARPDILQMYRMQGVEIINTPDQNQTDFTKCLKIIIDRISSQDIQVSCIVAFVSFGGRLDHILGNVNTLFIAESLTQLPVYLISGDGLACLLQPGRHVLELGTGLEAGPCGLIPLGQPVKCISTTGLQWNLNKQSMEFGSLVSTSNLVVEDQVTIETDTHVLWTMSIKSSAEG